MRILGISCYFHDASAALIHDGEIIAAVEEERFTRKKHDSRFPTKAIRHCLAAGNIKAAELDMVCFYEKPLRKLERIVATGKQWKEQSGEYVQSQLTQLVHERLFLKDILRDEFGYEGPISYTDHHLAHAACAYYTSPFDNAALMTVDAVGEWASTVQFKAEGNTIKRLREIHHPHSLGMLYSTMTAFLGFKVNNDEYKVMGLASYGQPRYEDHILQIFKRHADGSFRLDLDYFSFMYDMRRMYSDKFTELFGAPRSPESPIDQRHMDLAASLQKVTEDTMVGLADSLFDVTGETPNICMAGGLALNCVANVEVIKRSKFDNIHIPPAAADGGGSLGAALYCYWHNRTEQRPPRRHNPLLGPSFNADAVRDVLDTEGAFYEELSDDELFARTADLIHKNQIIGWYQGGMEFGPRALGNRSILANPCNPEMKDIINSRVKFREDFRPFAPAAAEEYADDFFELGFPSPYMLFAPQVCPGMDAKIPAVTHHDNTARAQTVSADDNPRFHRLITEFGKISGVPVLLNTSFNVRGEPIVCTPQDAYACFMKSDIDFLVMGNCLVDKGF